jgi:hypothetical protein
MGRWWAADHGDVNAATGRHLGRSRLVIWDIDVVTGRSTGTRGFLPDVGLCKARARPLQVASKQLTPLSCPQTAAEEALTARCSGHINVSRIPSWQRQNEGLTAVP